ncbi:ExeA family protein [Chitinimonas sp. BJYL2]|uniref:ExeA family protein n=1 Tax=Chitinimonas sp. BJYL2 TaxID=2976696 RepID=UPI0022B3F289|nr:AAA family ATPase [Chitinimonas sp. BJYL2]
MYLEHYGLSEPPFRITPHTEFFYQGANRGATLEALQYAILHGEGLVKVTGEVGAGKTMLCRVLMERLPEGIDTVYLANPSLSKEEILRAIADDLRLDIDHQRATVLIRALQEALIARYAAGRQVVVLIDEAHAMPEESLEEIRLLSNLEHGHHKLMQIVLFGQPELDAKLAPTHMRQLRERITHSFELVPLRQTDVGDYLMFRLRAAGYKGPDLFSPQAIKLIAAESEGLTRRINILADKALIASFAAGRHQVDTAETKAAIRDSGFRKQSKRLPTRMLVGGSLLVAGLLLGAGASRWLPDQPMTPAPAIASQPSPPLPAPKAAPPSTPPAPPETGKETSLYAARLQRSMATFARSSDNTFTIQLASRPASEERQLMQMLVQAGRSLPVDNLYFHPIQRQGQAYTALFYGLFTSQQEAAAVLAALPSDLQRRDPLLRTVAGVRADMPSE